MVCNFREIQFHTLCNDRFDHNTVVLDTMTFHLQALCIHKMESDREREGNSYLSQTPCFVLRGCHEIVKVGIGCSPLLSPVTQPSGAMGKVSPLLIKTFL